MTASEPTLCVRWGDGEDRCVKPYGHLGPCEDTAGNTTLSLTAAILNRVQLGERDVNRGRGDK